MDLDNQEKNNSTISPSRSKGNWGKFAFVVVIIALIISIVINSNDSKSIDSLKQELNIQSGKNSEEIKKIQNELSAINLKYLKTEFGRDSLKLILMGLNPYRPLVGLLSFRDSVQRQLPFKVGSIVSLKPDSAIAVIKDIIISGSDYEFSIQYRVITKTRNELLVTPALINKE